jgi:hypothetical protein
MRLPHDLLSVSHFSFFSFRARYQCSDRQYTKEYATVRGAPEPSPTIARGLQAEKPFIPMRVMNETNILDLEIGLTCSPFYRPSQVGFVELLPQFGDFNRIGRRKQKCVSHRLTHHDAIPFPWTAGATPCPEGKAAPASIKVGQRKKNHIIFFKGLTTPPAPRDATIAGADRRRE